VITHLWVDDAVRFFEQIASRVGWTVITQAAGDIAQLKSRAAD
jgi:hypothetical protein